MTQLGSEREAVKGELDLWLTRAPRATPDEPTGGVGLEEVGRSVDGLAGGPDSSLLRLTAYGRPLDCPPFRLRVIE
jgi:hypothetical protein